MDNNTKLISELHDIHGLSDISFWPLAAGWWLVLFLFVCTCFVVCMKSFRIMKYKKSWRYKIEQELDVIIHNPNSAKAKENISRINDILKRLSIKLYGRQEPASLSGKKWLAWLTNHDPRNFNWLKKGEILIEYPYMKDDKIQANSEHIAALAKAIKPWLKLQR